MNPGLVVKLRPNGPWRIGPDSGARNRVDVIYHSDSLYSAVTGAMSRMESLAEWLDATARSQAPAVCFSSCFPFLDDIGFVVPPRTLWPPTSPALMSARVRWKSARFIPLSVVESILSGRKLNEHHWSVDGASGCLVPVGKPGPFRTSVRWNAAVDRLSGACERHATACIEFRQGCGLWTVVGFRDDAARDQWQGPVKAAFRLLADTGFGGERSRGWGRAETPEFVEGTLPGLIVEYKRRAVPVEAEVAEAPVEAAPEAEIVGLEAAPPAEMTPDAEAAAEAVPEIAAPDAVPPAETTPEVETVAESLPDRGGAEGVVPETETAVAPAPETTALEIAATPVEPEPDAVPPAEPEPEVVPPAEPEPEIAPPSDPEPEAVPPVEPEPEAVPPAQPSPEGEAEVAEPALSDAPIAAVLRARDVTEPMRVEQEPEAAPPVAVPAIPLQAHWLLSLFTPAADDAVDWARGSYTVLARGGRIDSPSGSGELKKQIQMVAEGSVLYADGVPLGTAADVAPDGFAHPVFRAGFALAIPLPEVH